MHSTTFLWTLLLLILAGCTREQTRATAVAFGPLEHDFGTLRHGERATHVFVVPTPDDGFDYIPVGFQRKCTCASHEFLIHGKDGEIRYPTGQPFGQYAVRDGERLELVLHLDTSVRESASASSISIPGQIVLQADNSMPPRRELIPISFRFGIAARIQITPAATIDFGRMPHGLAFARTYSLRGVDGPVRYGAIRCVETDPSNSNLERDVQDVMTDLVMDGDEAKLKIEFKPSEERPAGPCAMRVEMETDLPGGYRLVLPVSAFVVESIEVRPAKMLFGQIDLSAPFTKHVQITDHDRGRPAEFYVKRIVDQSGADASQHFAARFEPIENEPRSQMLLLDYRGTLTDVRYFRGSIDVAKEPSGDTVRTIEFSGFRRRR